DGAAAPGAIDVAAAAAGVDPPAAVDPDAAADIKGPADPKAAAAAGSADAAKPHVAKPATAARTTAPETGGDATEAAVADANVPAAAAKGPDKAEHTGAPAGRPVHQEAAAKPDVERSQLDPQIGVTADKPAADVVQLVMLQHPTERSAGAGSV